MTSPTRLAALIALCSLAIRAPAQEPVGPPRPPLAVQIGAFLEAHHAHRQFSGTALVADDGEIVYQGAFGLANDDWSLENDLDTKFRVGSITKQFTAMLVLLLVEEGKLELTAPILRYLPDYPPASGSRVTIHHLLNHTSGIPSYEERTGWQREQHHLSVQEFVARFCSDPLEAEPGTAFRNSNSGYYLLGAIIEAVTGPRAGAMFASVLMPVAILEGGCLFAIGQRPLPFAAFPEVAIVPPRTALDDNRSDDPRGDDPTDPVRRSRHLDHAARNGTRAEFGDGPSVVYDHGRARGRAAVALGRARVDPHGWRSRRRNLRASRASALATIRFATTTAASDRPSIHRLRAPDPLP